MELPNFLFQNFFLLNIVCGVGTMVPLGVPLLLWLILSISILSVVIEREQGTSTPCHFLYTLSSRSLAVPGISGASESGKVMEKVT